MNKRELILESDGATAPSYSLYLRLPYPVELGKESASFSRKKGELTVTLPVWHQRTSPVEVADEQQGHEDESALSILPTSQQHQQPQPQPQQVKVEDVNPHARWVADDGRGRQHEQQQLRLDPAAESVRARKATAAEKEERPPGRQQQQRPQQPLAVASGLPFATPPYRVEQRPNCFTLIVDAAGVDAASIEARWADCEEEEGGCGGGGGGGSTMSLAFRTKGGEQQHRLSLRLWGRVDASGCRVDVASRNVLVVVCKAKRGEAWPAFEAEGVAAAGAAAAVDGKRPKQPLPPLENEHLFELDE